MRFLEDTVSNHSTNNSWFNSN